MEDSKLVLFVHPGNRINMSAPAKVTNYLSLLNLYKIKAYRKQFKVSHRVKCQTRVLGPELLPGNNQRVGTLAGPEHEQTGLTRAQQHVQLLLLVWFWSQAGHLLETLNECRSLTNFSLI